VSRAGVSRAGAWLRRASPLLALVVLAGLLVLAAHRIDLARAIREMGELRPGWLLAGLACYAAILPAWGVQWWLLAPRTPLATPRRLLGVVAMTSSVLNTTPMLVGEAAGVFFLARVVGIDRAAGLGVLAMDQLLVGLAKLCVLTAAAAALTLPRVMRDGLVALGVGVAVLLIGLLLLAGERGAAHDRLAARVPLRIRSAMERTRLALAPLRSPRLAGSAFALALFKKGCEIGAILCIQRAFGVSLPVMSAVVVLAALNLATLLPVVPGNAGVFEAAVVLAYGWLGLPAERALGMAVVQHVAYFVALALPGYAWLGRLPPAAARAATPYSARCAGITSDQS
jgi:uncharacterized membrane protein YbhN (UPF0104 family)